MKFLKIIALSVFVLFFAKSEAQIKVDTYQFGEGLNISGNNGSKVKLSGYLQPFIETRVSETTSENTVSSRFRMRRARFRLDGTGKDEKFKYRVSFDVSGVPESGDNEDSNQLLLDAYVSYNVTKRVKATFGQRTTYTDNRELLMPSHALQLVERSRLTSAFASIREFGLFVDGRFKTGRESYIKPYFTLTNGDGLNVFRKDRGGLKVGGRLDYLPFGLFTNKGQFRQADMVREATPKLVVGANISHNRGMSSRRGRSSPNIVYLDANNEESLPDFTKFGADFMLKYKGFSLLGEYVKTLASVPSDITQRVRNNGTTSTTFEIDDKPVSIEDFVLNRMALGEAVNIQGGYLFKNGFSIDARYTHLNADTKSFLNNTAFYNRPNHYTLGVSKYLARNYGAKIQADFTFIDSRNGNRDANDNIITGDEYLARLILTFAL